ncbi:GntR family transcriptional regulator [uncultured Cohaesibacter sp.]|uniref:GntR family transcriptional regulator n=1 Tax=uncultured Cohaesibacter sp. TaxID=1002546 RepID=UPI0029C68199|nr:GntR family transcriptional regulator [uncultured Cohaesibacter sp.]
MIKSENKQSQALDALRRTICLASPDEEMLLRETVLTEEFGMSRTPIRQILQRLAYEGLVETRSGVGTVVVALLPEHRSRDFLVHQGMLQTALRLDLPKISISQHSDILALSTMASLAEDGDRDLHYDIRYQLYSVLSDLIPDPLLRDVFSASYWRTMRRYLSDVSRDPMAAGETLRYLVQHVAGYEPQNATDLFNRVLDADSKQIV